MGPREIASMIRHSIEMRHFFPDKYRSQALASGDEYLVDEMEEYKESMLDYVEKGAAQKTARSPREDRNDNVHALEQREWPILLRGYNVSRIRKRGRAFHC